MRRLSRNIPCSLTIVGSLATSLEIEPLSYMMSLISSGVCQFIGLVVFFAKIGKNSTRLPKDKISIGVFDHYYYISLREPLVVEMGDYLRDMPGTRPLGLRSVNGGDLTADECITFISYGRPNSSRTKIIYKSFSAIHCKHLLLIQTYLPWIWTGDCFWTWNTTELSGTEQVGKKTAKYSPTIHTRIGCIMMTDAMSVSRVW